MDVVLLRGSAGGRDLLQASHLLWANQRVSGRPNLLAGEDLPPAPRQKRSLEKRARIKAAAIGLFRDRGFQETSIEDIARKARVPVGGFYQHYRSKRQLLLALMDDLLETMAQLDLRPAASADLHASLRDFLARAFSGDLRYLGAYRAWREAALSDRDLARKQRQIRAWTTRRVTGVFLALHQLPGARAGVDIPSLARHMDSFFWNLLGEAVDASKIELDQWIDSAAHLMYHALFKDRPVQ
jgi:AcrR family transcriptional regulator